MSDHPVLRPDRPRSDRRAVLLGALLGAAGAGLAVVFKARCGIPPDAADQYLRLCYSDVTVLYGARGLADGAVPYLDAALEYPPLTGLWMWLAAVGTTTVQQFFWRTASLLVVSGAAIGGLLAGTVGVRRTLVVATAPTLVVAGAINWDLPSMALAVAGLVAHRRGRDGWAGVWLGLGTAAKLWPALLVLPVALAAWSLRGRPAALRAAGAAAATWLAVNVPVAVAAPENWARFLELSSERGATLASAWWVVPDVLGRVPRVGTMNLVTAVLLVGGTGLLLWITVRRDDPATWHLVGLPLVALFLLTNKVYSPQFSLWLLPLLALAAPRWWALALFAVADVAVNITEFGYLASWIGLEGGTSPGALNVAAAARFVLIVVIALTGWRREVSRAAAPAPRPMPAATT